MDDRPPEEAHKRRPRYRGTHPRAFTEKYKELNPDKYQEDVERVIARGDTPAGTHRPICLVEVLEVLHPAPGSIAVDATLGYGGHSREILKALGPEGRLLGFDVDPSELPKTEARLRQEGYGPERFTAVRSNFAALPAVLAREGLSGVDSILADLGVSSMQIDNPERGFTFKRKGPLDMRMNPLKGRSAAEWLKNISVKDLTQALKDNADEVDAEVIAAMIVGKNGTIATTQALTAAIREALAPLGRDEEQTTKAVRRTFQAVRIAVNGEFSALETFLADLPWCLNPGGRVAILTFHSGEDKRVVRSFENGKSSGLYARIHETEIKAGPEERYSNPRSTSARLRWAEKA